MIGILICGHGNFGTGIYSAVRLLSGYQQHIIGLDFDENSNENILKIQMQEQFDAFNDCKDIIVLCDILGGTPFKTAVTISQNMDNIHILYGANIGMALELCMQCMNLDEKYDINQICEKLLSAAKEHIGKYVYVPYIEEINDDGI